jgi:hypothetical protein
MIEGEGWKKKRVDKAAVMKCECEVRETIKVQNVSRTSV